jgi:hypothetical protein
VYI